MHFSFSLREFLHSFSVGFIFVIGIIITNMDRFSWLTNAKEIHIFIIFICIYIIGILIFSIGYFLQMPCYQLIKVTISEIKVVKLRKFLEYIIILSPIYILFRRWSIYETFLLCKKNSILEKKNKSENRNKPKNKNISKIKKIFLLKLKMIIILKICREIKKINGLPECISHLETYDDLAILTDKIFENAKSFNNTYFYKSQFFQGFADSVFFIFLLNISILRCDQVSLWEVVIYIITFFILKALSPMYARLYFFDVSRKATALNIIGNDNAP